MVLLFMKSSIPFYQKFYCITYYDKELKKRCRENNSTIYGARYRRNELLMNKQRYSMVSQVFESSLEVGSV